MKIKVLFILSLIILGNILNAQTIRGKLSGTVVDKVTQAPLIGANIFIMESKPVRGASSDTDGFYSIANIPVGRYNIQVSYIGYESKIIPEILIGTSKTKILNIELKETVIFGEEVIVTPTVQKDKPLNDMVLVSGRSFTVEEANRYAGGIDDPARLVTSFAGVTTGMTEENGIVIRGNAPKGLLWKLEGIEIPNPNHFFGLMSFGGGGVSALSSMMLDNSDFLTGAFPAEYGNALSGVFDLKLKTGNKNNFEHAIQIGMMGIDLASEGPINKRSGSSYAFNYRYSTLGVVKMFIEEDMNIPVYQDLTFKLNFPTKNKGTFSLWSISFLDNVADIVDQDSTKWEYLDSNEESNSDLHMGVIGLSHKYILDRNTFVNSTISLSSSGLTKEEWLVDQTDNYNMIESEYINSRKNEISFSSHINHKFNTRHYNKTGINIRNMFYNIKIEDDLNVANPVEVVNEKGNSSLLQGFTQSDIKMSRKLSFNLGMNFQYFTLSDKYSIEPRASLKWKFDNRQSLSFGYGLHSRLDVLSIYMVNVMQNGNYQKPNKNLELTKAHHFVFGYNLRINENTSLKIEPYYQHLFDVPTIADSSFSLINLESDWYFNSPLNNSGTGRNVGIDLTLERYLSNNYYYLVTASLFDSKYKGGDNIDRDTRFNSNYVFNVLGGKEWILGREKNKILGVNLRLQVLGGRRRHQLDTQQSILNQDIVYNTRTPFQEQDPMSYHSYITFTYRKNKPNYSSVWSLQLYNFPSTPDNYGYEFNLKTGRPEEDKVSVVFPMLSYKIEF